MAKYQKKVVQIEAYKLGSKDVPQWFDEAIEDDRIEAPMFRNYVLLNTQKGQIRGYQGDYMILNPDGSLYLCKKALFDATYEPSILSITSDDMICDPVQEIGDQPGEPNAVEAAEVQDD